MNEKEKIVLTELRDGVLHIYLNKPEKHNALDSKLIKELTDVFKSSLSDDIRIIVLSGKGKSFCSGADLQWMKEIINYDFNDNIRESNELAELLYTINRHPKPVIALVKGAAIGGGAGLMSACDIIIAEENTKIGFTEVRLGLAPAVISPFVVARLGYAKAKELFLTGEILNAKKAFDIGLVNIVTDDSNLEFELNKIVEMLSNNSPNAIKQIKELIYYLQTQNIEDIRNYTVNLIANLRISNEGQEGMNAFLEKRKPYWQK